MTDNYGNKITLKSDDLNNLVSKIENAQVAFAENRSRLPEGIGNKAKLELDTTILKENGLDRTAELLVLCYDISPELAVMFSKLDVYSLKNEYDLQYIETTVNPLLEFIVNNPSKADKVLCYLENGYTYTEVQSILFDNVETELGNLNAIENAEAYGMNFEGNSNNYGDPAGLIDLDNTSDTPITTVATASIVNDVLDGKIFTDEELKACIRDITTVNDANLLLSALRAQGRPNNDPVIQQLNNKIAEIHSISIIRDNAIIKFETIQELHNYIQKIHEQVLPNGYNYYIDRNGDMQIADAETATRMAIDEQAFAEITVMLGKLDTKPKGSNKTYGQILAEAGYKIDPDTEPSDIHKIITKDLPELKATLENKQNEVFQAVLINVNDSSVDIEFVRSVYDQFKNNKTAEEATNILRKRPLYKNIDQGLVEKVFNSLENKKTDLSNINEQLSCLNTILNNEAFKFDKSHNKGIQAYTKRKYNQDNIYGNAHETDHTYNEETGTHILSTVNDDGVPTIVEISQKDWETIVNSGLYYVDWDANKFHSIARLFDERIQQSINDAHNNGVLKENNPIALSQYITETLKHPTKDTVQFGIKMSVCDTSRGCIEAYFPEIKMYVCLNSEGKITTIIPLDSLGRSWYSINVEFPTIEQ